MNGQDIPKPSYAQERYSIQIGGPLMIPKVFRLQNTTFAFNFTGNRADNLSSRVGTVPTLSERIGRFLAIESPDLRSPPRAAVREWPDPVDADQPGRIGPAELLPNAQSDRIVLSRSFWHVQRAELSVH